MPNTGLSVMLHSDLHTSPPAHPESARRLETAAEALLADSTLSRFVSMPATREQVLSVHLESYLKQLEALTRTGGGQYDTDTYITPTSLQASFAVSGALIEAVRLAFSASGPKKSIVIGRPPGHHAESDRAMGFCIFNHVAVAAQYAIDQKLCECLTIFDFDLHHGNGTQEIFYRTADVQYISTHQYPFYPGTGNKAERGSGPGEGYNLNLPLDAGAEDTILLRLLDQEIIPAIEAYRPDLLIISAGFDGHHRDPLGNLAFTAEGFGRTAELLRKLADSLCEGRIVSYVEGGYDPDANKESILAYTKGIATP